MNRIKVLEFASYATLPELEEFNKNHSGYGYMVGHLIEELSSSNELEIHVLTQSNFTTRLSFKNIFFVKKTFLDLMMRINHKSFIKAFYQNIKDKKGSKSGFLRKIIYSLTTGFAKSVIHKFDIIHIHGLSFYTFDIVRFCLENRIPAVVTLHGINYLNKSIKISNYQASLEKYFIEEISKVDFIKLTVISTGIKNRIIESLMIDYNKVEVITNFTKIMEEKRTPIDIRKYYQIPENSKIILSVGNVSKNKNQTHLIDVFEELSKELDNIFLLFVGNDSKKTLINYSRYFKTKNNIRFCGEINYNLMPEYYLASDVLAVTSISEGFGLPIVEAGVFGVPTICYTDLDAVEDIYDGKNMMLVDKRSIYAFKERLKEALSRKWDKKKIVEQSTKFTGNEIRERYCQLFKDLVND